MVSWKIVYHCSHHLTMCDHVTVQLVRAPSRELVAMLENTETGLVTIAPEISGHSCGGQCPESLGPARPRLRRPALTESNLTASGGRHRGQGGTGGCNPASMERLRGRCELLMDACISPLALSLTDKELAELRDKMEAEVCAYLSCDLYWSLDNKPGLNIGLLLLTTLTAATLYLLFVYHLVWVWY